MPTLEKTKPIAMRRGMSQLPQAFHRPTPSGEDRRITRPIMLVVLVVFAAKLVFDLFIG